MLRINLFSNVWKPNFLFRILFVLILFKLALCKYKLKVTNDGPTMLDTSITFLAELEGYKPSEEYSYIFEGPFGNAISVFGGGNASLVQTYKSNDYNDNESFPSGEYVMKVIVKKKVFFIYEEIAKGRTVFVLTDTINGNLTTSAGVSDVVAVNTTLNVTFNIHDPSGFFNHADMDYAWSINEQRSYGLDKTVNYNVIKEGPVRIDVVVHARVPNSNDTINKWGFIKKDITALRPVSNITVDGNVFIKQGDILYLDFSCEGSDPFSFCTIVEQPDTPANANLTCDPVFYSQCSFHYQYYFPHAGKHAIGALIGNKLGVRRYPINIEIYDVSKKAQLSTVIVPIFCCLLAMVIVVGGIAYHVHQRKAYVIEVADFDFQQPLPLNEKTFVERLKESYKVAYNNCNGKEVDAEDAKYNVEHQEANGGGGGGGGGGDKSLLLPINYGAIA